MSVSISILIPTRGRPEGLRNAVSTLVGLASEPKRLEFLLRSDNDDTVALDSLPGLKNVHEFRGPRLGYRRVFEHYNEMAAVSKGDWIINWNDDVEMLTAGWDEAVRRASPHSIQFFRRDIFNRADTTFPCTGRSVYKAMGHLSLQTHADDWMRVVADKAGVGVFRDDIEFHHHRINDQTSKDRDRTGYDTAGFNHPQTQALILLDAERVRAARSDR